VRRIFLLPFIQACLLSNADVGKRVEKSKNVAEPPQNANDDDRVQNRLDGTRHWDELINQPQNNPDDNQCEQYLD
jgi:hypothetical protein